MATINTKVSSVRVYATGDSIRYRVVFFDTFPGIIKNENDDYVESEVNYVDFIPSVIIAQAIELIPGLSLLYNKKKEQAIRTGESNGFGAAELLVILADAKITFEREKFDVGDEYTDANDVVYQHEHAGYRTTIKEIVVRDRIQQKLDAMIDKMFDI